ncbi:MAG: hypothetical protein IPM83_16270 [Ignavibacteria bacterium]|nr:hypothetical protein [Ignavibacteria bacterium]
MTRRDVVWHINRRVHRTERLFASQIHWVPSFETVIAERENVFDAVSFASGRMFLTWMIHVHHEVEIADMKGKGHWQDRTAGLGTVSGFAET